MRAALLCLLLFAAACGGVPASPPSRPASSLADPLTLPPGPGTFAALAALEREAQGGSCAAARARLRYLIDLFDLARLTPNHGGPAPMAHALLWRGLGLAGPPARGRLATRLVFERLRGALAASAGCREGRELALVGRLLEADQRPRRPGPQALAVVVAYKDIARGSSPLAPNAALRLYEWCAKAFRLAAGGLPSRQHVRLAQCLYPLFDADPSPYFAASPAERPTDPPWTLLAARLQAAGRALRQTRFASLAAELLREDEAFFARAAAVLPTPLELGRGRIPRSVDGQPWDRTPVVQLSTRGYLVGGQAILEDDLDPLPGALGARLRDDVRRRVAVAAPRDSDIEPVLALARAAARAGATTLELGVTREVAGRAPAGDAQAALGAGPVVRLEVIPISIRLFAAAAGSGGQRDEPHHPGDGPDSAPHRLSVSWSRDKLWLASIDGTMELPRQKLPEGLLALSRAYPEDTTVALVPQRGSTYGQLVELAGRARGQAGRRLFFGLTLSTVGREPPATDDLGPALTLFGAARVEVTPEGGDRRQLRSCYRDALRARLGKGPPVQGTLVVELRAGRARVIGGDLRDRGLERCALGGLDRAPGAPKRVTVRFTVIR